MIAGVTVDPETRDRVLAALGLVDRHLPGKHDQSSHGRKGPAGAAKTAAKKAVQAVSEATAKSFGDTAAGRDFIKGHYADWHSGLSSNEDKALSFWQSPGFQLMNGQLRGHDVAASPADLTRAKKATGDLRRAIDRAPPLPESLTVHRGFSAEQFDLRPGSIISDAGFVSVSLTEDGVSAVARHGRPAVARITLPKGMKVGAGHTRELILPPGTKFKVVSVRRGRVMRVELEAILP